MVAKATTPSPDSITFTPFINGRLGRLSIKGDFGTQIHWNLHNFALNRDEFHAANHQIRADIALANETPLSCTVFFVGDFNFPRLHAEQFSYLAPSAQPLEIIQPTVAPRLAGDIGSATTTEDHLRDTLSLLLELEQPCPTQYSSSRHSGRRIDRAFVSTPSWVVPLTEWRSYVFKDPIPSG